MKAADMIIDIGPEAGTGVIWWPQEHYDEILNPLHLQQNI
jgi:excinuclease UvrABC ATPase subunit